MGNKTTLKVRKRLGKHNYARSKGTGHINPNFILNSDWLKLKMRIFGSF